MWGASTNSQTKATTGNAATDAPEKRARDSGSGVVSRPGRRGGNAGNNSSVRADLETGKVTIVHHRAHDLSPAGRAAIAEAALAAAEARTSKPKPKRKPKVVAKDGTNRGRPANAAKGKPPFDKKAHDREKARERRAAAKAAAAKP